MTSGLLLMDKSPGLTSFEVVRRVKRRLAVKKIGHLGTLDPLATGLLPLCLGEATKLVPYLMPGAKTYRARVRLGITTTTQDAAGEVVSRSEQLPTDKAVLTAAAGFVGEIDQVPPMYSARHHEGERLYKLARRGEVLELPPRQVTIYELAVEEISLPDITLRVSCSQGTYIRTLAHDLGAALGCGAHLAGLRRLAVGPLRVEEALPVAALEEMSPEQLAGRIIPLADCLPGLPRLEVGSEEAGRLRQGQRLLHAAADLTQGATVQILSQGELVAVAVVANHLPPDVVLAPERVFAPAGPAAGPSTAAGCRKQAGRPGPVLRPSTKF